MIFFTTQKSTGLRIHGIDKNFRAAPPQKVGENSFDAETIYADTVGSFSNINKLLQKHEVSCQVVPEEAVRSLTRFPLELGVSNFGEANGKRSPIQWLERDRYTLPQQLSRLSPDKAPRIALLNGLGAALGDTLIGLTAMRIVQRVIRDIHGDVELDALLRMDLHHRLVSMYAQANLFRSIQTLPVTVQNFLNYRGFFDFSGFVRMMDALPDTPMLDFYLLKMGINPADIPSAEKRNSFHLAPPVQQQVWQQLAPLKAKAPLLLFHPKTSTPIRDIPPAHHQRILEYLIAHTHYHIVSALPVAFQHPRFTDLSTLSESIGHLAAIIARMDAVLSADTVVYHIADAFSIPTVVMFNTIAPDMRVKYYAFSRGILLPNAEQSPYFRRHKVDPNLPIDSVIKLWDDFDPAQIVAALNDISGQQQQVMSRAAGDNPDARQFLQQALQHHQRGELEQAECLYQQILELNPRQADTLFWLGQLAMGRKQFALAEYFLQRAISSQSRDIFYHALAQVYRQQNQNLKAERILHQALENKPTDHVAWSELGFLYAEQGHAEQALECYQKALAQQATVQTLGRLATTLRTLRRDTEALHHLHAALRIQADNPRLHQDCGDIYQQLGDWPQAQHHYQRACELNPNQSRLWNQQGVAWMQQHHSESALACFQRALSLKPDYPIALNNLALVMTDLHRYAEAEAAYQRSLSLANTPETACNYALLLLLQGQFATGWELYRQRLAANPDTTPHVDLPRWDGMPLNGRHLLVYFEQGLGDTLQFVRYLPLLPKHGGRISLVAQPDVIPLLHGLPNVDAVLPGSLRQVPAVAAEVWLPLLDLPQIFHTELATIPAAIPYLTVPEPKQTQWQHYFQAFPGNKIGLVWAGRPTHHNDARRSFAPHLFTPLATVAGMQYFSLQKGDAAQQVLPFAHQDLNPQLHDFSDTAAALQTLDLLITADTAIAHLAGALGRPAWVLLPFAADWRWLTNRQDSPWYPSMRLFRQPSPGDWDSVMQQISAALASDFANAKKNLPAELAGVK